MIAGVQLVACAFFSKVFGTSEGLIPEDTRFTRLFRHFNLERGLIFGVLLLVAGLVMACYCFGQMTAGDHFSDAGVNAARVGEAMASSCLLVLGVQVVFLQLLYECAGAEDGESAAAGSKHGGVGVVRFFRSFGDGKGQDGGERGLWVMEGVRSSGRL